MQNKSIQLFTNHSVCNVEVYVSVPACALLLMLCSYPRLGALLCALRNALILGLPESVAECGMYKRPISVNVFWALLVFAELDECHGIIPSVLPLLLSRDNQKTSTNQSFSSLIC